MYSGCYTDSVGRSFCQLHGRDSCNECMMDFTQANRFAEENAGLRPKLSRADELTEEKDMVKKEIAFIMSQDQATQAMMKENLVYHQSELRRIEEALAELQGKAAIRGWKAVWGTSGDHLALFRLFFGGLLVLELVLRFRFLRPFYSNEGTLPLPLLMDKVDDVYKLVCLHCRLEELWQQYALLAVQVVFAIMFTLGIQPRLSAAISWFLYLSLTLRNTWMSYILDRYFHYLLFLSILLPWGEPRKSWNVTPATVALKLLLCWIYFDAGYGKLMDPLGGWTYGADPLPALDTYARHTLPAQYLYALAGPEGLRIMTPVVVWIELLAVPVAMIGLYLSWKWTVYLAVALIVSMHVGIALCLRNSALLSLVACAPWFLFFPPGADSFTCVSRSTMRKVWYAMSLLCLLCMAAGNVLLYTDKCDQSVKHIWSTLLHNRWNVFVGAEEYVTWEIAPGELQDGSVVDVWGRRDEVNWSLPGDGAPCTATSRPGRWRSFPYLAGLDGDDGEALWSYLCKEWDRENKVDLTNPGRHLVRYNFFMLQADVLPNMSFTETRKRLIHTYDCPPLNGYVLQQVDGKAADMGDETNIQPGRDEIDAERFGQESEATSHEHMVGADEGETVSSDAQAYVHELTKEEHYDPLEDGASETESVAEETSEEFDADEHSHGSNDGNHPETEGEEQALHEEQIEEDFEVEEYDSKTNEDIEEYEHVGYEATDNPDGVESEL